MNWHSVPHFHDDDAPLGLLADILARGKASRLYQKLVIEREIAQDVTAYQSGRELAGSFGITVTLRPTRQISELRALLEAEIAAIATAGVTGQELERVVTMKTASFLFALEHMGGFGGVADRLNAYNVFRGNPALITTDLERFQKVTPETIQAVAKSYLDGKPCVALSVIGRKSQAQSPPLDRKNPPAAGAPAFYRAPTPEVLTLSNGIPVWVLPHHDLPTVALSTALAGGGSLQPPARAGLLQLTVSMMDEGTKTRSAAEIATAAEAMGTSLAPSCGWDGAFVSFRCLKALLEPSLDLAVDLLREPTFPEHEWQRIHGQTLAALRAERDSAESRAYRGMLAAIYHDHHPYRYPLGGVDSIVAGLERSEAIALHGRCLGPGRAGVVVAGDVDPEAIARLLETRLADWNGPAIELPEIPSAPLPTFPRILLLNRPGACAGRGASGPCGDRPLRRRFRTRDAGQPDPWRPVHLTAQREAPRGEGLHLRRSQPLRHPPG